MPPPLGPSPGAGAAILTGGATGTIRTSGELRGDVSRREVVLGVRVGSLLRGHGDDGVAARGREPRLGGVHPRRGVAHVPRPDVHRHPVRGGSVLLLLFLLLLPRVVGGTGGSRARISRHGGARERVGDARVPEPRRGRSRGPVERRSPRRPVVVVAHRAVFTPARVGRPRKARGRHLCFVCFLPRGSRSSQSKRIFGGRASSWRAARPLFGFRF